MTHVNDEISKLNSPKDPMSGAEKWHIPPMDNVRPRLGEGMTPLPVQPTVIATHVVDLAPLVSWWRETEQRLRDQLAVERTAASSAREALASCEARCKAIADERDDAKEAQRILMDARMAELQARLDEAATVAVARPSPGSVEAVIEAYRLLVGDTLKYDSYSHWHDNSRCADSNLEEATWRLLHWLDEHAPGGRP